MKRVSVTFDEETLRDLRKATGQKTNAAAIRHAIGETVRVHKLKRALDKLQKEAAKGDFFWPNYLAEIRPNAYAVTGKKRPAAYEKRLPRRRGTSR